MLANGHIKNISKYQAHINSFNLIFLMKFVHKLQHTFMISILYKIFECMLPEKNGTWQQDFC